MATGPFISYAQNAEDVLLWRALGDVSRGSYVDVGAWHAVDDSVTKAFYDRGWRGVSVEPAPEMAAELRALRPGDEVIEAAVSTRTDDLVLHRVRFPDDLAALTGLSTTDGSIAERHAREGWRVEDVVVPTRTLTDVCSSPLLAGGIHFLKVDVEGAEADVLRSLDLQAVRPWVLVVEATEPGSTQPSHQEWEPYLLENGYDLCLFDGLSRYYTAREHAELAERLSYPVCVFDEYVPAGEHELRERLTSVEADRKRAWDDVVRWRALALDGWSASFGPLAAREKQVANLKRRLAARRREVRALKEQLELMGGTMSWRVTRPLRVVRSRVGRSGARSSRDAGERS